MLCADLRLQAETDAQHPLQLFRGYFCFSARSTNVLPPTTRPSSFWTTLKVATPLARCGEAKTTSALSPALGLIPTSWPPLRPFASMYITEVSYFLRPKPNRRFNFLRIASVGFFRIQPLYVCTIVARRLCFWNMNPMLHPRSLPGRTSMV